MNSLSLVAIAVAAAMALTAGKAVAQTQGSTKAAPWVQTGDAAYPPPPNAPPAGTHYEWIFSYDRHGDYLGHWEVVRNH